MKKMFRDAVNSKGAALRVLESSPFEGVHGPDRGDKKSKQWLFPDEASRLRACDEVPMRSRRLYALSGREWKSRSMFCPRSLKATLDERARRQDTTLPDVPALCA